LASSTHAIKILIGCGSPVRACYTDWRLGGRALCGVVRRRLEGCASHREAKRPQDDEAEQKPQVVLGEHLERHGDAVAARFQELVYRVRDIERDERHLRIAEDGEVEAEREGEERRHDDLGPERHDVEKASRLGLALERSALCWLHC
jgi:hypothetical protein